MTSAIEIPTLEPGNPEWATRMSASKIAAVVDRSPYESRFSLWHKMRGNLAWDDGENVDEKRRGHYLEPALRQWFRDTHPGTTVLRTGTWQHVDRPWQIATPDALIDNGPEPFELLECKTSAKDWEWGDEDTDQIAGYYLPQVQWSMDTLGAARCHVAVLTSYMVFRHFVVDYDPGYAEWLRFEAEGFLASIDTGVAPDIDDHTETYKAVRRLHPGIEDTEVEVPDDLAQAYAKAQADEKAATATKRGIVTQLAHLMGDARTARTATGALVAYRKTVRGNTPHISPAPGLAAALLKETA